MQANMGILHGIFFEGVNIIISTMQKDSSKLSKRQMKREKQKQKKKQQNQQKWGKKEESDSDGSQEYDDFNMNQLQEQAEQGQIDVNFLVAELNQEYYHSLKTILLRFAEITKTTNSELADAVLKNKQVGNISLAEEDDDQEEEEEEEEGEEDEDTVYSVLTILPGNLKVVQDIKKQAIASAKKHAPKPQLQQLLSNESTALLLNERLPNLPPFISTSYHEVFKKDLSELKQKDKKLYNSLCSGYLLTVSEVELQGDKKDPDEMIYSHFQNYEMCQRTKYWWVGQKNASKLKKKVQMANLYCLISCEEYFKAIDNFKNYLE